MIVAECCENWHDIDEAKKMIRIAHELNPNGLVKFQLHDPEDAGFTEWTKNHALTFDQAKELFDFGASIGQEVFFSVFGVKYVEWCERIGVKRYKLACDCNSNIQHVVQRTGKRIIQSDTRIVEASNQIEYLWCPSGYPPSHPILSAVAYPPWAGFSDHSLTLIAAKVAIARGARIIERHFMLGYSPIYPDAEWSMTPDGLRELVRWEKVCQEVL